MHFVEDKCGHRFEYSVLDGGLRKTAMITFTPRFLSVKHGAKHIRLDQGVAHNILGHSRPSTSNVGATHRQLSNGLASCHCYELHEGHMLWGTHSPVGSQGGPSGRTHPKARASSLDPRIMANL